MDSKTKFNRLTVCHPLGAGLDLPPACHSSRILRKSLFLPLFTFWFLFFPLLFLCMNAEGHYSWSLVISYYNSGYAATCPVEQAYVFCNCMSVCVCVLRSAWVKTEISVTTDVILAHAYVYESPPSSAVCVKLGIRKYHLFFFTNLNEAGQCKYVYYWCCSTMGTSLTPLPVDRKSQLGLPQRLNTLPNVREVGWHESRLQWVRTPPGGCTPD